MFLTFSLLLSCDGDVVNVDNWTGQVECCAECCVLICCAERRVVSACGTVSRLVEECAQLGVRSGGGQLKGGSGVQERVE